LNNVTGTLTAPRKIEALMEIHCQKEDLLKGVQLVQNAISPSKHASGPRQHFI
jgi:hypothetical protein